ncbi:T7SS effector LXG polymorphic toxin [Sporosarcina sp. SG10008]|uniref:T7SS effector LXG polymorphic toxin n=1 Tax=Sporosarcina sp. SG10008 TaxID=3373103 RepID=UPI0037DC71D7
MLNRLENEMKAIETAVEGLVAMEDSLKGQGGDAIRAFYAECHLPFLQFFMTFKSIYVNVLTQMDSALDALEPDANGFIRETFLEGEVEAGLTEISQLTSSLTDEANDIMNQVADIVALPHLNDSDVQEGVRDARRKRDRTIADLYEFDANQTRALIAIENDLKTMETWISDIEGLFTDGVTAIDFPMDKWAALSSKNTLQTDLAQRTAGMDGVNGGQVSGDEPGNLVGANTSEDEQMKALYAAMEKEQHVANPVNDYAIDPNTGEYLMTFEGKRKVLGGNGTGTIDGFAPYGMATYDFYLGDIGTMLSPDASAKERFEAALFTFVKPLKLADTGHDILKVGESGKLPVETGGKIQIVDGKKQYNVNGTWLIDKQFSALRQKAVRQAWKHEKEYVRKNGKGTRDWTPEEIQELLQNGKVKGYEGQHMKSANDNPDFAGDPDNIQFLKGRNMDVDEHLDAHGGSYHNPTNGYYDPKTGVMVEFGDEIPWNPN